MKKLFKKKIVWYIGKRDDYYNLKPGDKGSVLVEYADETLEVMFENQISSIRVRVEEITKKRSVGQSIKRRFEEKIDE